MKKYVKTPEPPAKVRAPHESTADFKVPEHLRRTASAPLRLPLAELLARLPLKPPREGEVHYELVSIYATKEEYEAALRKQAENESRWKAMSLAEKLALIRARSRMSQGL